MKIKTILALVLLSLIIGWIVFLRSTDGGTHPEMETGIQIVDETILGTIPATEENIPTDNFSVEDRIAEHFSKDEIVTVAYIEEQATETAEAFVQVQFEGHDSGIPLSDGISYAVSEGESIDLEIVRCIWTPEDNIVYVGLYNLETKTGYAYAYTGGNTRVAVSFTDLSSGSYVVYIKNMGDDIITDGTLRYRINWE